MDPLDIANVTTTDAIAPAALQGEWLPPEFPPLIDNSMREAFVTCPRKFWYGYSRMVGPKIPSVHLHAGGAFARGLEVARRCFYEEGKDESTSIGWGVHALLEYYGDYEPPFGINKTATRMAEALIAYFHQYPLPHDYLKPLLLPNGKRAIEFTFALPIDLKHPVTGYPLLLGGRFDMLAEKQDVLFVDDEKTTTQLGPTWVRSWDLSSQFSCYCWGARQYGYPVAGAIVRGISILKEKFGHAESIQLRPQWMIDRWYEQVIRDVKRMIQSWEEQQWDMALGDACKMYGGCGYTLLCTSPDPEKWIENHYAYRKWDPMSKGVGGG